MFKLFSIKTILLIVCSLTTSCTLPRLFFQHVPEPVTVPEMKRKNTKSFSIGSPGEVSFGYHLEKDVYTEAYVQRRGLTTSGSESGNKQESIGGSIHKIFGSNKNNISFGIGVDAGQSEGNQEKNSSGNRKFMFESELIEHKLSYKQSYAQASVMFHNEKTLGIGLSYKRAWGQVQYNHGRIGLPSEPEKPSIIEEGLVLGATEEHSSTQLEKTKNIAYGTLAFTLRSNLAYFVSDKINLDLQYRNSENLKNFRSKHTVTFRVSYDFN